MLTRWDPFTEMSRLQDELFRSAVGPRTGGAARPARPDSARAAFSPAVDVHEDADAIFVQAELPGLRLDDVEVGVENDVLTLSGERKSEREEGHYLRERWHGAFSRSFKLPRTVDVERIEATLKDGVLSVRLPKRDNVKPRKIEVRS
jgi:HSP20 family protein